MKKRYKSVVFLWFSVEAPLKKEHEKMKDKVKGALVGLACGDAVGTTVEFKTRGTFEPLTDMIGGGPFNLEVGQWTDDMSGFFGSLC